MQVQGGVAEEGEDDTVHESLQHLQQAWHSVNVAGNLLEHTADPRPSHIYDIQQRCETRKSSSSDSPVLMRDIRQDLDVGDGVDDAG